MNFEAVIGLEIHVEMKTKSKMFSSSPNGFTHDPNTEVTPFDMAFPGTMPRINKQAVINAIRVANALHMSIDRELHFDRKNYFYADLPKGFQITQQFRPIGSNGYLDIPSNGGIKRVGIERIHMEEDTCKQLHFPEYSLLDYNRAGVPLVEIVSRPDMRSGAEAMAYVEAIRNIVVFSGTSDGKMEEGSLRVDVNVSIRPYGTAEFGTKVELKNLNSLKNIQEAIDYEVGRQASCLLSGIKINQETRRYDEASGKTVLMRIKTDAVDYKYFPEPNLVPVKLSEEFINNAIDTCPELYDAKLARYTSSGLSNGDAKIILSDLDMALYFEEATKGMNNKKTLANWLIVEVNGYLNKNNLIIKQFPLSPSTLAEISSLQGKGYTHKQCADIFNYLCDNQETIEGAIKTLKIEVQESNEDEVLKFVIEVLDANPQSIEDYKGGKDRAIGYLIGQVMKLSKGKVNPQVVAKVMNEEIAKR